MIKLKSLTLKSKIIQSPMAGCTDLAFRMIARDHGMEFAFLEMISADALVRKTHKTYDLMKSVEADRPLGAQLVGCRADTMGEAAEIIEGMGFDLLDINFGCPVPKIVSPGGGSAMLREPDKARDIFRAIIKKIKKIPVTVKMRTGFTDASGDEAVRIAKIAEEEGLSAVTVHGRTRAQGYSGTADWNAIGKVKAAVNIPVIGNGDVTSGQDALRLMAVSGCDGVMIGRGALGNPWIYKNIENAIRGEVEQKPANFEDRKKVVLRHLELAIETEGERLAYLKSKKMICWYFKHYPGAHDFRANINRAANIAEMRDLIHAYTLRSDMPEPDFTSEE
jgi:tRNA-dihydrouridine synthase B